MRGIGAVLVAAGGLIPVGCAGRAPVVAEVNHVVLFKLEDPSKADALLAESEAKLRAIPGVRAYFGGRHVEIGREGVTSDYDAAVYVGFDDVEAYRAYLGHPLHEELVEDWRDEFAWVRIYDIGGARDSSGGDE